MDISGIIKRAWEITWKHKGFWVLGILASCSGGGGSGNSSSSGSAGRTLQYQVNGDEFPRLAAWLDSIPEETWGGIGLAALGVLLLLALITWALGVLGTGGLIAGFQQAELGEDVSLSSAFQVGASRFWKLLAIQLIPGLLSLIIFIAIIGGMIFFAVLTAGIGVLCLLPLLCILVPLGFAISVYTLVAQIALLVEDLSLGAAFQRAWEVLRENPGNILILALALGVLNVVAGFILAIPFFLLALPFLLSLVAGVNTGNFGSLTAILIGSAVYLPILLTASGILRTFITGVWTLAYRDMTTPDLPAAL